MVLKLWLVALGLGLIGLILTYLLGETIFGIYITFMFVLLLCFIPFIIFYLILFLIR